MRGVMAKVTVYLPDDLHRRVSDLAIPISPTCQRALEREVAMKTALTQGTERIVLEMRDRYGERHWSVAFIGRWLVAPDDDSRTAEDGYDAGSCYGVALTTKGNFVVYVYHVNDRWPPEYKVYASLAEALDDHQPQDIISIAAQEVGEDLAVELDI
jgi:hypothetical protein